MENETKNVNMENESTPALSEDIYSTQDNLLGDMNIGSYSENIQIQPVNTSVSSWRQFEPICKFHRIQVFHDEMTFQNLTQGSSYTKEPELESQMYNHTKDPSVKQASLKEESPVETPMSVKEDQLIHERVRGSQSPPLNYCSREMMEFMEKSLATYTAADSVLNLLYKESISRNDENVFDNDNSFDLHDLRVDYKTEKPEVSSKEIENSGEVPEMSVSQEEVTAEGLESLAIASCWSAAGVSKSGAASQNCMTPDISFQSLDLLEEDVALNEALQKLKHTNKQQEMQIQDLQCRNLHLECKIKELQMKITKQQVFVDIINKLKETVEELIENKYNLILEKNDINKKFQDSQKILSNTQRYLQEFRKVKDTLQLQVKKIKVSYIRLQERYATEMQQKNRSISQCMEMEKTLSKKDEEIESLHQLKGELEKTNSSTLELLKREKEIREQEFLSFQEEFQRHEKESLRERRKLKSRVEKLIAQVKNALVTCENERAKNTKLQQQIDELKNENSALQQQVAESKEQCSGPSLELTQLKKPLEGAMEPESAQGIKAVHSNLIMNYSSYDEESLAPPAVKKTFPLTSKIHSLLTLMVGLLVRQDIASPDAECCRESKKATDITLYKLKSFQLKKKDLDKELLKHKNKITTLKELIANAKSSRDSIIEVTGFDADHAMVVRDVPIVLATKLDTYHRLNEELDFLITKLESLLEGKEDHCNRLIEENDRYRRHVGSLINKVTSYEEIIKCADQRLEISHSQIAHLEERNRHLEDLIRMPREKARKPKPRLESHPKSMTVVGHPDGLCHDCSTSM